jgi:sugar porter (SP) family MFS transporter
MLTVPYSPRWLVDQERVGESRAVLRRLREGDPEADVDAELRDIEAATERSRDRRVSDLLRPNVRPLLLLGIGLAAAQQFVGINTVIYYAPTILASTGLGAGGAISQTVFIGLTNVIFTVVAVLLLDRLGRRSLLLAGTAGLLVGLVILGIFFGFPGLQHSAPWLALAALLIYIASFAVGLGPVFWLMISEVYPQQVRSIAMSTTTAVNWAANFLVSVTFLSLIDAISRPATFFLYAAISVLALIYFWRAVPETKGRSLEAIQHDVYQMD